MPYFYINTYKRGGGGERLYILLMYIDKYITLFICSSVLHSVQSRLSVHTADYFGILHCETYLLHTVF